MEFVWYDQRNNKIVILNKKDHLRVCLFALSYELQGRDDEMNGIYLGML